MKWLCSARVHLKKSICLYVYLFRASSRRELLSELTKSVSFMYVCVGWKWLKISVGISYNLTTTNGCLPCLNMFSFLGKMKNYCPSTVHTFHLFLEREGWKMLQNCDGLWVREWNEMFTKPWAEEKSSLLFRSPRSIGWQAQIIHQTPFLMGWFSPTQALWELM